MSQQLYARVFTQILDSSLAEDWQTRHVFEDLLKLADNGVVDMTRQAIVRRTNVPAEIVNAAIAKLEGPDPNSRDDAEEGRRIVRLDEHRDWGWRIVNWEKYEAIRNTADQRAKVAARVRRHRGGKAVSPVPLPKAEAASEAASEAETPLQKRYIPLHTVTERYRGVTAQPNGHPTPTAGAVPASCSDAEWLAGLKADSAYEGIDVDREHAKMLRWCQENKKKPTRRRLINWLNRADRPLAAASGANRSEPQHQSEIRDSL